MRRLVAIAMLSALFVTAGAASPAFACGCGVVVGPPEQPVAATNERALELIPLDVLAEHSVDVPADVRALED